MAATGPWPLLIPCPRREPTRMASWVHVGPGRSAMCTSLFNFHDPVRWMTLSSLLLTMKKGERWEVKQPGPGPAQLVGRHRSKSPSQPGSRALALSQHTVASYVLRLWQFHVISGLLTLGQSRGRHWSCPNEIETEEGWTLVCFYSPRPRLLGPRPLAPHPLAFSPLAPQISPLGKVKTCIQVEENP